MRMSNTSLQLYQNAKKTKFDNIHLVFKVL